MNANTILIYTDINSFMNLVLHTEQVFSITILRHVDVPKGHVLTVTWGGGNELTYFVRVCSMWNNKFLDWIKKFNTYNATKSAP